MIAYNHYIKFIPELKNAKKVKGTFSDIITVQKVSHFTIDEQLSHELTFFNNQGRHLVLSTDREFTRTQKGQLFAFEVQDVVTFLWQSGTLNLNYIEHDNFTEKLLEYWCLHIILPVFFTIEETFDFLHAGAVEIDGNYVLFVAESFGGKSTITDYFMTQGHKAVSDDKVATYEKNGMFFSVPSHPFHRPYRNMEDLGFFIENFATKDKLLHAVYELKKVEKYDNIVITEMKGIDKLKVLSSSSIISMFFAKIKKFKYLMKMANTVPVYKVNIPWDLKRLNEVYDSIVAHAKTVKKR